MNITRRGFIKGLAVVIAAPFLVIPDKPLIQGNPKFIRFDDLPLGKFGNRVPSMQVQATDDDGATWYRRADTAIVYVGHMQGKALIGGDDYHGVEYFTDVIYALPPGTV